MIFILVISALLLVSDIEKDLLSMKWFTSESWEDCPNCKGTGEVEIEYEGSGNFINCPCTMELR